MAILHKNCPRNLLEFIEGQLSPEDSAVVTVHVAGCDPCKEEVQRLRATIAMLEALPAVTPPANLWHEVEKNLTAAASAPARSSGFPVRSIVNVAAVLLVLLIASLLYSSYRSPDVRLVSVPSQNDAFEQTAMNLHLKNVSGSLELDLATQSTSDALRWITHETELRPSLALYSPDEKELVLHGVKIVPFGNSMAVCIAYEVDSRPVTLLVVPTSSVEKAPSRSLFSKKIGYRYDPLKKSKLLVWSQRKESYALVSDLPDFGQKACFICHATPSRRQLIQNMQMQ